MTLPCTAVSVSTWCIGAKLHWHVSVLPILRASFIVARTAAANPAIFHFQWECCMQTFVFYSIIYPHKNTTALQVISQVRKLDDKANIAAAKMFTVTVTNCIN